MKRRNLGPYKDDMKRPINSGKGLKHHLVHVTSVGAGREIIEAGKLEARACRHFGKDLVYFFIDRVGYRPSGSDEKSDQINRFPFVFVQPYITDKDFFHAYPFDTGAALSGLFEDKADPHVYLEDYELQNNLSGVSAHILWAFDNHEDYIHGDVSSDQKDKLNPWDSVERSFFDIAHLASPRHNRPDNRASAVEVAFDFSYSIHKNQTFAVFPKQLIEWGKNTNHDVVSRLNSRKIQWETYNWMPNSRPIDFFKEISETIAEALSRKEKK